MPGAVPIAAAEVTIPTRVGIPDRAEGLDNEWISMLFPRNLSGGSGVGGAEDMWPLTSVTFYICIW